MAEIVLGADDTLADVAQALLELAGDTPDQVMWSPRPDVAQGGVYVVPDELAAQYSSAGSPTKKGRKATTTTTDATSTPAADASTGAAA